MDPFIQSFRNIRSPNISNASTPLIPSAQIYKNLEAINIKTDILHSNIKSNEITAKSVNSNNIQIKDNKITGINSPVIGKDAVNLEYIRNIKFDVTAPEKSIIFTNGTNFTGSSSLIFDNSTTDNINIISDNTGIITNDTETIDISMKELNVKNIKISTMPEIEEILLTLPETGIDGQVISTDNDGNLLFISVPTISNLVGSIQIKNNNEFIQDPTFTYIDSELNIKKVNSDIVNSKYTLLDELNINSSENIGSKLNIMSPNTADFDIEFNISNVQKEGILTISSNNEVDFVKQTNITNYDTIIVNKEKKYTNIDDLYISGTEFSFKNKLNIESVYEPIYEDTLYAGDLRAVTYDNKIIYIATNNYLIKYSANDLYTLSHIPYTNPYTYMVKKDNLYGIKLNKFYIEKTTYINDEIVIDLNINPVKFKIFGNYAYILGTLNNFFYITKINLITHTIVGTSSKIIDAVDLVIYDDKMYICCENSIYSLYILDITPNTPTIIKYILIDKLYCITVNDIGTHIYTCSDELYDYNTETNEIHSIKMLDKITCLKYINNKIYMFDITGILYIINKSLDIIASYYIGMENIIDILYIGNYFAFYSSTSLDIYKFGPKLTSSIIDNIDTTNLYASNVKSSIKCTGTILSNSISNDNIEISNLTLTSETVLTTYNFLNYSSGKLSISLFQLDTNEKIDITIYSSIITSNSNILVDIYQWSNDIGMPILNIKNIYNTYFVLSIYNNDQFNMSGQLQIVFICI